MDSKLYSFSPNSIDAKPQSLADYRGKALLIVNVASHCGYTPHYQGMEALYRKYQERGLVVLGFPCNQFAAEEPGSDAEIKKFCETQYGVSFPMFSKIDVNGPAAHPLYKYLTTETDFKGDIDWNFAKFLSDKSGKIVARWKAKVEPEDGAVLKAIEEVLL